MRLAAAIRLANHVDAPRQQVFALWTDLDRMREWVGGVTRVTDVTGPVEQAGTRYTVWFGPMRSPTEVLEVEWPGRIRTRSGRDRRFACLEPGEHGRPASP